MNQENISILSIAINFCLAGLKLSVGLVVKSSALIADGIHSTLDIVSSFITFLGTKIAKKPADEKHPYGHLRSETIAGFVVTFLLLVSAIWIIYEGVQSVMKKETLVIGYWALIVVVISIVVNEIMARAKFKIGRKQDNLALIADAQHSRADSISSMAVLVGLFLTRWFSQADGATAILVGLYILYETFILSREVTDNLLDISDQQVEEKIKKICQEQEIDLLELRSRKIGPQTFAELKIGMDKEWKMEKVEEIIKNLQNLLIAEIEKLNFVVIQVTSHQLKRGYLKSRAGQIQHFEEIMPQIKLKKLGYRTIIPVKDNKLYPIFGSPEYLVIDKDNKGDILQKKIIKNPYFTVGRGHGMRFAREIESDQIIVKEIGANAREIFEKEMNVKIKIIPENTQINEILKMV